MLLLLADPVEETEAINPVVPDLGEMFWGATMFILLYLMVRYVLLPPVTKVMDERSERIKGDKDAAEAARQAVAGLANDRQDQLADVKAEAAAMMEQARTEAEAERASILSQAEREVLTIKDATRAEIEGERSQVIRSLRPEVVKLSVAAARKVLDRDIDPNKAKPVLESHLEGLS